MDHDGRLVVCEQGARDSPARISRIERRGGEIETLVDAVDGAPLDSPNDVIVASDGAVSFTEPSRAKATCRAAGRRRRSPIASPARTGDRRDPGRRRRLRQAERPRALARQVRGADMLFIRGRLEDRG